MNFLANENFPVPSIRLLRNERHFVYSIFEEKPGLIDSEVIKIAIDKKLVILTFDKDYGELIFRYGFDTPPSVIFFRAHGIDPSFAGNTVLTILSEKGISFDGYFTVIDKDNVRQRKY